MGSWSLPNKDLAGELQTAKANAPKTIAVAVLHCDYKYVI